jgi:Antitoxin SocA-like, Panacea domain
MGPVVGALWHTEKDLGPSPTTTELTESQLNTVGYVLSRYGTLTGQDLERLTHAEMPWRRANESRLPHQSSRIEQDWLLHQFREETDEDAEPSFDSAVITQWLLETAKESAAPARPDTYDAIRARLTSAT